jgi:hypothetical protein
MDCTGYPIKQINSADIANKEDVLRNIIETTANPSGLGVEGTMASVLRGRSHSAEIDHCVVVPNHVQKRQPQQFQSVDWKRPY